MRLTNTLLSIVLAGTAAATLPACSASGRAVVVAEYEEPPPPMRQEYVVQRAGYVWVHGNWVRDYNNRWRWQNGYYVRERPGYAYQPGRWVRQGRR
ncbi:MAG TPA: hypothetical protein VIV11_12815, partial [Kofleriaceae bacterium]